MLRTWNAICEKTEIWVLAVLAAGTTYLGYGFAVLNTSRSMYLPVLALGIPVAQLVCLVLALIWVWRRRLAAALVALPLVMDFGFFQATLSLHIPRSPSSALSLLTWNTESLNFYDNTYERKLGRSRQALDWLISHPADIKFMQEFEDLPQTDYFCTSR